MKQALLIASSLALLSLVPAASADISILNGTAVIHTGDDPGVSALGNPVARVGVGGSCFGEALACATVYGNPGGVADYEAVVFGGSCTGWEVCIIAAVGLPPEPGRNVVVVADLDDDPGTFGLCAVLDCLLVEIDPLCVSTGILGDLVCET